MYHPIFYYESDNLSHHAIVTLSQDILIFPMLSSTFYTFLPSLLPKLYKNIIHHYFESKSPYLIFYILNLQFCDQLNSQKATITNVTQYIIKNTCSPCFFPPAHFIVCLYFRRSPEALMFLPKLLFNCLSFSLASSSSFSYSSLLR